MTTQLHPDTFLMIISAIAAVLVAYIESRRREPTQHSYERYNALMESMIDMRERMAKMEQCYRIYPSADFLCKFEYETRSRLDKLECKLTSHPEESGP